DGIRDFHVTGVQTCALPILAGGEGTRLRPLTSNAPKPMLPIANRPMMEHVLNLLKRHGFDEVVVTVAFLANAIETYFGDGSEFEIGRASCRERVRTTAVDES